MRILRALPERDNAEWTPLSVDQTELAGITGKLLVTEPTDDAGWPAELPPGTEYVAIIDDEPNVHVTLRVWTPGPGSHGIDPVGHRTCPRVHHDRRSGELSSSWPAPLLDPHVE
ncbi:DUF7161 family protein [Nocardia australiensis]|uniref:DUF7161 family protein n=1 Tax=Nocardia australiensis TaxID=2887191 RepID=UPI003FD7FA9C